MEPETVIPRFEDLDDVLDGICEDIIRLVCRWILFSKIALHDDPEGECSLDTLVSMITQQFEADYPRMFPLIEKTEGGMFVTLVRIKEKEDEKAT